MFVILSIFTGMLFILIKTINMMLAKDVGIYKSNVVNHLTGTIGALIFVLLFVRQSSFQFETLTKIGIFPLIGGLLGATFVCLSNYTLPKTKVLISTLLILMGQTVASVIIDYFVLGQIASIKTLIGTVLIVVAVILYNEPKKKVNVSKKIV